MRVQLTWEAFQPAISGTSTEARRTASRAAANAQILVPLPELRTFEYVHIGETDGDVPSRLQPAKVPQSFV